MMRMRWTSQLHRAPRGSGVRLLSLRDDDDLSRASCDSLQTTDFRSAASHSFIKDIFYLCDCLVTVRFGEARGATFELFQPRTTTLLPFLSPAHSYPIPPPLGASFREASALTTHNMSSDLELLTTGEHSDITVTVKYHDETGGFIATQVPSLPALFWDLHSASCYHDMVYTAFNIHNLARFNLNIQFDLVIFENEECQGLPRWA